MIRVFIAHAKGDDDAALAKLRGEIAAALEAGRIAAAVTLGRDDFEAHFPRLGSSWQAWCADVVSGFHPVTREPRYTHLIVPTEFVGKATADMVATALRVGKPVLRWRAITGKFTKITKVTKETTSVQTGWRIS
jgi:hypothetical protein